nr:uncharacterized protein K02A2.6-like [Nomia melanderi]
MECIMWGHRIVIPESLQKELLAELHSAHMGIVRMKALARSYIWWPKIDQDIENVSRTCKSCLENADNPPRSVLHTWDWSDGPNHRIHADILGPIKGRAYLIIVDAFSKWVDVKEMTNITAPETIKMFREYFCTWGITFKLVTDNGPTFTSESFSEFVRKNGIRHIKTAPYHPATNGAAENSVKTFKTKFKLLLAKNDRRDSLMKYLFHYRSSPHCTTGVSPAELQCSRKFRTRWNLLKSMVGERVTQRQIDQKHYFRGNRKITFINKETVMAKDYACDRWRKSELVEKLSSVSYKVRTEDSRIWKRHIDQLRSANVLFGVEKCENTGNYDECYDEDTVENVESKTDVVTQKERSLKNRNL